MLSTIACFRSPVELTTLEAISKPPKEEKPNGLFGLFKKKVSSHHTGNIEDDLKDLVERGLLHFDAKNKKFDLHPIVRRFAYDRFSAPQRADAHVILVVYIESLPPPPQNETLEDLAPVIELYHHMVRADKLDEARVLFRDRLHEELFYQFGAYQLYAELLRALFLGGEDKPPRLKEESAQAWTLNSLANAYGLSGQPRRAIPPFTNAFTLWEKASDKESLAIGLGNVAQQQLVIGALSTAERDLRRSIDLCREIADEFCEAIGHQELGRVLSYRGAWQEAEQELDNAIAIQQKIEYVQTEGISHAYRALRFLLMAREEAIIDIRISNNEYRVSAIECAGRALELADEDARTDSPTPRDYVRAYWLLGAAYLMNNDLAPAEENLSKALDLCRQINMVDHEADILLGLARLRYAQGDCKEAQEKASEALAITERCGYVLTGADVNLMLAELALEGYRLESWKVGDAGNLNDREIAVRHVKEALRLARCDDGPPYHYKVAYEEAQRFLEKLK
ncbi:MAG: tetratricopeptide repeat protein [Bacteroidota bacterium]